MTEALNIIVSLIVIIVLQTAGMYGFALMTPFNDTKELNRGNVAVGLAFGGKFLATSIILGVASYTNSSVWHTAFWFLIGYVCLIAVYWIYDWLTPGIKLSQQLLEDNRAVGTFLACAYVGMAFAISSLII